MQTVNLLTIELQLRVEGSNSYHFLKHSFKKIWKILSFLQNLAWISSDYFESLLLPERRKRLEAIEWISGYLKPGLKSSSGL